MNLQHQSNENQKMKIPKSNKNNNLIISQRMEMKNDFTDIEDNKLARTQMIPDTNYFDLINKKKNYNNKMPKDSDRNKNNDRINMSQNIFNNNYIQSFNEQNNINQYDNTLGKSQQILPFKNKK